MYVQRPATAVAGGRVHDNRDFPATAVAGLSFARQRIRSSISLADTLFFDEPHDKASSETDSGKPFAAAAELLAAAGYDFEVLPPSEDAESGTCGDETPGTCRPPRPPKSRRRCRASLQAINSRETDSRLRYGGGMCREDSRKTGRPGGRQGDA